MLHINGHKQRNKSRFDQRMSKAPMSKVNVSPLESRENSGYFCIITDVYILFVIKKYVNMFSLFEKQISETYVTFHECSQI